MLSWKELSLKSVLPPQRGGHTSCFAPHANQLLVFAGADAFGVCYNDIFSIELCENSDCACVWAIPATKPDAAPSPRCGHSVVWVEGDAAHDVLLLFGGFSPLPAPQLFGDVWTLTAAAPSAQQCVSVKWELRKATGTPPCPRHAHCCVALGNPPSHVFVFGGSNDEQPLNDCFLLELATMCWKSVALPTGLGPREMAAAAVSGTTVALSGGRGANEMLNDAWEIDIDVATAKTAKAEKQKNLALRRCGHSMFVLPRTDQVEPRRQIVAVVGGFIEGDDQNIDEISMENAQKKLVRTAASSCPAPIHFGLGHSGCIAGRAAVVVSGLLPNVIDTPMRVHRLSIERIDVH